MSATLFNSRYHSLPSKTDFFMIYHTLSVLILHLSSIDGIKGTEKLKYLISWQKFELWALCVVSPLVSVLHVYTEL